jgi:hypothetical protein
MKVFLSKVDSGVMVQARLEGDGLIGDMTHLVRPAECYLGLTHDELVVLGNGELHLDPPGTA